MRGVLAAVLEAEGLTILQAATPASALRLVQAHRAAIDVIVTDVVMPVMNGVDFIAAVRASLQAVAVVFMTGHVADPRLQQALVSGGAPLLRKPFGSAALLGAVRRLLSADLSANRAR